MTDSLETIVRDEYIAQLRAELAAERERYAKLEAAACEFVDKIISVHEDSAYEAVWVLHHTHCGPYKGPTYVKELKALADALAK